MKSSRGYIIATVKDQNETKPTGYKLWYNGQTNIMPSGALYRLMEESDCIENAKLKDGEIVGSKGSLDRYGVITAINYTIKDALVIIKKFGLVDKNKQLKGTVYQLVNVAGIIKMYSDKTTVQYAEKIGLANGKVVTKGDSKIISAITGEYPYEEALESLFLASHEVYGYTNAGVDRYKTAEELLDKVSYRFNKGVIEVLTKHNIVFSKEETILRNENGAYKVAVIKYQFRMHGEDCTVYMGYCLTGLEGQQNDELYGQELYNLSLIDYAENRQGKKIYNKSFNKTITKERLNIRNMSAKSYEFMTIQHSREHGRLAATSVIKLSASEKSAVTSNTGEDDVIDIRSVGINNGSIAVKNTGVMGKIRGLLKM